MDNTDLHRAIRFGCGHDHSTFHPSLADAEKAGEITRGWIPDFLPKSSRAIRQVYDLSPSTESCEFDFAPAGSESLRDNPKEVQTLPTPVAHLPNPHVSWWPSATCRKYQREQNSRLGTAAICSGDAGNFITTETWLFAIDSQKGRAFFYIVPTTPTK